MLEMRTFPHDRKRLAERDGTVKRIHVDQQLVRRGEPAITVQTSAGSLKCAEATWDGPSRVVHSPESPLSCGAKVWIETTAPVTLRGGRDGIQG